MGRDGEAIRIRESREKELNKLIGDNIASLRKQRNLTQADVGRDLKLAPYEVSGYECGEDRFALDIIEMFAHYYNVPFWILSTERVPGKDWCEISDAAIYRLFAELPVDAKMLYVGLILKDWQISNPEKKLEERLEGRILRYLKACQKLLPGND